MAPQRLRGVRVLGRHGFMLAVSARLFAICTQDDD